MAFWNKYPYTNFHELNLDWILQKIGLIDKAKVDAEAAKDAAETAQAGAESSQAAAEAARDETVTAKNETIEYIQDNVGSLLNEKALSLGADKPLFKCIHAEVQHTVVEDGNTEYFGIFRLAGPDYYQTYRYMQGACYNSASGYFVIALVDSAFNNGILVEIDRNFEVIRRSAVLPIGHGNAIAFNPNNNKLYISTGKENQNIAVIDSNALTFDTSINLNRISWFITYDYDHNQFYEIDGSGNLNVFDDAFTLISSVPIDINYIGNGFIGGNGLAYYNNRCYYMGYVRDSLDTEYNSVFITTFTSDGTVESIAQYKLTSNTDEPENICVMEDNAYIFSGQTWFRVYMFNIDRLAVTDIETDYFGRGDRIPENADMNDYIIPGKYTCSASSIAGTLSNVPYKYAPFSLYVTQLSWLDIRQEFIFNNGNRYERYYNTSGNGTFTSFKKLCLIDEYNTSEQTVSVPNDTTTNLDQIIVPAGKIAFINTIAEFAQTSDAVGIRQLYMYLNWVSSEAAVAGAGTFLNGSVIVDCREKTAPTYVNIRARQNRGSDNTVKAITRYLFI